MQSKKMGDRIYLRVDKDEDVLASVMQTCKNFSLTSAIFQGIGACERVGIQTCIPEKNDFDQTEVEGMLEMVSLNGNVTLDNDGNLHEHAHGSFAYLDEAGEHRVIFNALDSDEPDYEDGLIRAAAEALQVDALITYDKKAFKYSSIPSMTAEEAAAALLF